MSGRRVHTTTVLQMEAVECGAASLSMVLGYHGRFVPLEELRVACGVSRDGSKASNIARAARSYGLNAKGRKLEPGALEKAPMPAIVFWNFNHFLVVEGHDRNGWYLNDPAQGHRQVSDQEFDESFTGVVIQIEKGPDFEPGGQRGSLWSALRARSAGAGADVAFLVTTGLALTAIGLVIPTFTKVFVDSVLVNRLESWVRPLVLGMLVAALLRGAATALQQACIARLSSKLALSTAVRLMSHVLRLPAEFFSQRHPGEVAGRIGLATQLARLVSADATTAVVNALSAVFYAALMLSQDRTVGAVAVSAGLISLVVLRRSDRRRTEASQRLLSDAGKLAGVSMAGLQNIEVIKAGGGESDFFANWTGYLARGMNNVQELGLISASVGVVPGLLMAGTSALILAIGGLGVIQGRLTLGDLVAIQSLGVSFLTPIGELVTLSGKFHEARGVVERVDDVLRFPADTVAAASATVSARVKLAGAIALEGLTFGYSRLEPPLIENFSLKLIPGTRVALVGGSGSGKSTIARLITGLYRPWAGSILFDGQDRGTVPHDVLVNSVAFVDQDIMLFEGTVRENLTLWDSTIPDAVVVRAAQDARIDDVISARRGGYDSLVEEGGRNFSGGQRQRLEIARALATEPSILVMDEATSALDPLVEQEIDRNLRRRGVTCVIVAHRLSTVRDCDEIIVLRHGKVAERGTHDQLFAAGGAYRDLITAE